MNCTSIPGGIRSHREGHGEETMLPILAFMQCGLHIYVDTLKRHRMMTYNEISSIEKRKTTGHCQIHEVRSAIPRLCVIHDVKPTRFVLGGRHHLGQVASACEELQPHDVLMRASGLERWETLAGEIQNSKMVNHKSIHSFKCFNAYIGFEVQIHPG